jgi:hypothetical protein
MQLSQSPFGTSITQILMTGVRLLATRSRCVLICTIATVLDLYKRTKFVKNKRFKPDCDRESIFESDMVECFGDLATRSRKIGGFGLF